MTLNRRVCDWTRD